MSTDRPDEINGEVISRSLQTTEQLPMGAMLLKMENEQIMSMARIAPRDPDQIIGRLRKFLQAYPAAAAEAVYAKPVGKIFSMTCKDCKIQYEDQSSGANVTCPVCGSTAKTDISQRQKYAEGLSIRAAESIRSEYGYTRLTIEMDQLEGGKVRIAGTLVDYAAGNMTSDERIVSPFYKSRDGSTQRTPEDRFFNVVVKAEKAKLRRDLILDSVPGIVKAMYRDECDKIEAELVPEEFMEQKIIPAFQRFGITKSHLESIIGRPAHMGWTKEESKELSRILNGLKTGDTTVAEVLRDALPVAPGSVDDPTKAARGDTLDELKAKRRAAKESPESGAVIETPETNGAEAKTPENLADSSGDRLLEEARQQELAENEQKRFKAERDQIERDRLAALKATQWPQDAAKPHNAPEVEQTDASGDGELPEPYSEDERKPVVEKLLASIDSAMTKKRLDAIAAQVNNDERLSDADLNDLVDKIAIVRDERNLN